MVRGAVREARGPGRRIIEVIKLVLGGGMVEFHGAFFDFDKLQMSPAPSKPVPFYVGGHTDVALGGPPVWATAGPAR